MGDMFHILQPEKGICLLNFFQAGIQTSLICVFKNSLLGGGGGEGGQPHSWNCALYSMTEKHLPFPYAPCLPFFAFGRRGTAGGGTLHGRHGQLALAGGFLRASNVC